VLPDSTAGRLYARVARFPHLIGDLRGGFASALVGLPYAITAAMLAVAPLGPAYVGYAMLAGLVSALIAGLVAIGGTPCQINGPRASVAVLMATLVALAMAHPAVGGHAPRALGVVMLCLAIAGMLQIAFGMLRMGDALRFLPYPVISGFMVGLGILVAAPQVPAMLGMQDVSADWNAFRELAGIRPGALLVAVLTVTTMLQVRKRLPKWPAAAAALVAGTVLHYALSASGLLGVGAVPWDLMEGKDAPLPWQVAEFSLDGPTLSVVAALLPATVTLAFVASLETLLSSSVLSIASNTAYDGRRELIGQGVANMAIAAAGGVASAGAPFRGVINYNAGGRTRLSGAVNGLLIGGFGLAAAPLLFSLPLAVYAGVLAVVGWDVAAAWTRRLAANPRADIAVGLVVMLVTLSLGTVPAILVGVGGAMLLYVSNTSRAPIRGKHDGTARASLRVRPTAQQAYLKEHGAELLVVELEGALFFGTADRCGREIEALARGCKHLIVDLKRVTEVDTTGAFVLMQTLKRLSDDGTRAVLASVRPGGRRGSVLALAGLSRVVPEALWFVDVDAALEDAENRMLEGRWPILAEDEELPLARLEVCTRLSAQEVAALQSYLQRESHAPGSVLFIEGAPGDCIYLIAKGSVTLRVHLSRDTARTRRLSTYGAGLTFGEMAVLEGKPRSAEAVCDGETVLHVLTRASLQRMAQQAPSLYAKLLVGISLHLASRLRATTLELNAAVE
jgi:sulfate permease, SulP family